MGIRRSIRSLFRRVKVVGSPHHWLNHRILALVMVPDMAFNLWCGLEANHKMIVCSQNIHATIAIVGMSFQASPCLSSQGSQMGKSGD